MTERPPIGVRPRYVHDQSRLSELFQAVLRYMTSGCAIPQEWIEEIDELMGRYKKGMNHHAEG